MNLKFKWEKGSEAAKAGSKTANLINVCKDIIERIVNGIPSKFMSKKFRCWETSTLATAAGEGCTTGGLDCEWYVSIALSVKSSCYGVFINYKDSSMEHADKDIVLVYKNDDSERDEAVKMAKQWFMSKGK